MLVILTRCVTKNRRLAIPRRYPPPIHVPAEFHDYVYVHEIIDSHLPGFVYLEFSYLLTQRTNDAKYEYLEYNELRYLTHGQDEENRHGPALFYDNSDAKSSNLSVDQVPCVRCLSWPPQAADWPARHRNYGWPDSATLDRVVSNGCDVEVEDQ